LELKSLTEMRDGVDFWVWGFILLVPSGKVIGCELFRRKRSVVKVGMLE